MTTDLRITIIPKSDQLNADDLIGASRTIKITRVSLAAGDQPVAINYDGDEGKPYLPCKSMRRVLVTVWGADGNTFVGKSLTLYRDEKVTWGGLAVGGIRISHMSGIDKPVTMALTAAKASRKPFTVQPLKVLAGKPTPPEETSRKQDGESMSTPEQCLQIKDLLFRICGDDPAAMTATLEEITKGRITLETLGTTSTRFAALAIDRLTAKAQPAQET